jgi:hypothetical protein
MANPSGDYSFAGLGFTALRFNPDGSQWIGYLYFPDGGAQTGGNEPISNATYTDATGVVTFSAGTSPEFIRDLNFTGNVILDPSGNVTAIAGTWTGRAFVFPILGKAAPAAEPATQKVPQYTVPVSGAWAAFNRQNTIT